MQDHFSNSYKQTIGLDFFLKRVTLPNEAEVALQVPLLPLSPPSFILSVCLLSLSSSLSRPPSPHLALQVILLLLFPLALCSSSSSPPPSTLLLPLLSSS